MIRVENVSFKYKNSKFNVLDGLDFTVNDGEIIAIVGQNGSGKSTIGRLLTGINKLKNGCIIIDDLDISKSKDFDLIRQKVGIVFQNPENQIIFNSIYDEISFSLKGLDKLEIHARVDEVLKQVGMSEYKDCDLYSLSLGQKQRIVIAEVLAKKPKYIIFDEPTTMIDSQGKETIYNIIKDLKNKGYTIICITNLADEILLADRTFILDNGKIACEIDKNDLINSSYYFKKFGIQEPTLLKVLTELKENGIDLNLSDFSVSDLVNCLKGKILNE
jgi:energy-coupling factor transport system ATP-binding protein